ncbi:membrane-bound lytic murein transglycosylase MltC [Endozoicomonas gorgoniicola]|uniref:Membrane-bound lytic murein transglycosylase MltC n=1 Tax=Endozoicomonas gorgoniicola TaxID=1234144 RepID=A0ABT3MVZ2_9GAMM|nr:membrane-bound lytic murein transglycosylase MltC [Endozoicomonas gorgoniicola]MCW7553547.1 membrane-bound lytic murein transglycosylase MltC [Endozoicomonas gorgoniicola]
MPHCRLLVVLLLILSFLSGCSSDVDKVIVREIAAKDPWASTLINIEKDVIAFEALVRILSREARVNWGDEKQASNNEYVKYTNNYRTRVIVNFETGKIHVETLDHKDLRQAIIVTLLTPYDPDKVDLFSDKAIELGEEPMLYGQVLDHEKKPIRWEWRAGKFADYLTANRQTTRRSKKGTVYSVDIDLIKNHIEKRQYQYASIVRQHSRKYNVKESLIYAVMRTESSFNPYAVSPSNAYGLMQIIPATAGRDVFQRLKKRNDQPTKAYLFQPFNNVDTGTAYLHLLQNHYLKKVQNPLSKHYAVISAYNGGTGNVLKTFHSDRGKAMDILNSMRPEQVYWALTQRHPREESRNYLKKVTTAQKDFYKGDV